MISRAKKFPFLPAKMAVSVRSWQSLAVFLWVSDGCRGFLFACLIEGERKGASKSLEDVRKVERRKA